MRTPVLLTMPLLVLVAACNDSDSPAATSPVEVIAKAPERTSDAKSAKTRFTIDGIDSNAGVDLTAEGAFDFETDRGIITTDLPEIAGVQLGKVEALVDHGTIYLKVPSVLASQIDTEWLKLDIGDASKDLGGLDLSGLTRAATGDPSNALDNLAGATDVTAVGDDQVQGELTTHYRATLDLTKAAQEASSDEREALEKANELLGQSVPADIWVDREGRARKIQYTVDPSQANVPGASTLTGTTTFTYELFDFGAPVDTNIPPADKTADLADLAGDLLPG